MGGLFSKQTPVEDPHRAALERNAHLLPDLYPRKDGRRFTLSCGRVLGYAEYGDPNAQMSRVVVFMHGTPGTRFFFSPAHSRAATAAGVRIIVPERPGFGLSEPAPGRTLLSFADDVAELIGHLGISDVATIGYSAGGPYALALAKRWPLSVTKVAVVSSLSPPWMQKNDRVTKGMSSTSWWGYFVARRLPWLVEFLVRRVMKGALKKVMEPTRDEFTDAENEIFRNDKGIRETFIQATRELYSRRKGATAEAEDYVLFAKHWGFELGDMPDNVPVFAYSGEDDDKVTPNMWRVIMSQCPNVSEKSHLQPGKGHLYFYELFSSVLEDMGLGPPEV